MMARETRGSRRRFLSFWRPRAELTSTWEPSKSHQTGVTCGLPSGISVASEAKARFSNRSRYFSGIAFSMACGMSFSRSGFVQHYRRREGAWRGRRRRRRFVYNFESNREEHGDENDAFSWERPRAAADDGGVSADGLPGRGRVCAD